MRNTKLYLPESCKKCDRRTHCKYPCEDVCDEYKLYNYKNPLQNTENPQNQSISENHETANPYVARVTEDGNYDKTTLLSDFSISNDSCDCENNIENFLEFNVTDIEWVRVINRKIPYTTLIDKDAFLNYLESENEKYCNDNGLCPVCRNPLEKFDSYEEVCGSRRLVEVEYRCKYGCS